MEEAVVGAVVGASIQVLLQNLLNISQEQINLFWYCKKDLEKLKKSFSMVRDFLDDAETRQVTDNAVKRWLRDLEDLAFDADNVFDDINYQLLSKKVETTENETAIEKVLSFFSNNPIAFDLTLGPRIKDIIEMLEYINQRASEFGLQTRIAIAQARAPGSNASGSTETDSFTVDPIFIGRENDVSIIVEMLTTTPSPATEQVLSVLPIVGMGGLGKTTLARKVFNDKQIITHFGENRVWVHVSRNFDVLVLLKNILTSLTTENAEHGNREVILKKLQTHLGAKKYLLVLDDVWIEDREKWDDFVKSFSGISSTTGNFMIVTTRSELVASIVGTLPVHNLRSLSDGDCWSIIEAKAFRRGDNPSEFKTIGINIAKRCKGLPLAAKVFGGLLFGKSKNEWLVIEKTPLSNFGDGDYVYKILKLSFDNLSSPSLKKCFAFCSIFPKGYEIEKEKLIEIWMAEGFLQADGRNNINMETAGRNFVNILVHNSLLQVVKRDDEYDNVTHCNMHDLVHDLAYSILHENDKDRGGVCQSRYIGWKPSGDGLLSIPEGQEKYVRTLFFDGEISDINFSDLEILHSLTLRGGDHVNELPNSIRELKHLRYLDISETRIKCLPDSIGELYHMQTLRLDEGRWEDCPVNLPDSLRNLINLRHLHIRRVIFSHGIRKLTNIGKLTSLQTLPLFHVGGEKGCRISKLGNLKDLRGELEICNLEKVRDKYEAISANLSQKTNIYELSFEWRSHGEVDEEANDDESVLEGLQPHPNLKSLSIRRFKGKSLPLWITKMAVQLDGRSWEGLDNLMVISVQGCSAVEQLPALGHLPHLKSLSLGGLPKVRSIGSSFYNIEDCSKSRTSSSNNNINGVCEIVVFAALERLELYSMPNLIEWAQVDQTQTCEVTVFPRLEHLAVRGCTRLTRAPSYFSRLKHLSFSENGVGFDAEKRCGVNLTSLTSHNNLLDGLLSNKHNLSSLSIIDSPNMTHFVPFLRGGGTPSLKSLRIENCSSLRELPDDLRSLNFVEALEISNCPDLKSIPYPVSGSQQRGNNSLRTLRIQDCGGLTSFPIEMLVSCASSLEILLLRGLSSITNLGMEIGCVHRMPKLGYLTIRDVPKFSIEQQQLDSNNNNNNNNNNHKLSNFQMGPFPGDSSWDNVSYNETLDAMLSQFVSIRRLSLHGMEHWECLPVQIQHLTSLQELCLFRFGIQALPEWLENLSSLETLSLYNCKELRHLPSKQAMLRLSKLTTLQIQDSPLLVKEKRGNTEDNRNEALVVVTVGRAFVDSERPKISHIPFVFVY